MSSKAEAEHYTWGQNCDGWHLVRRPTAKKTSSFRWSPSPTPTGTE
ncbi:MULTISPECIES: hypothetical protein [unclassified Meiothermus]|nr:MULTISPECIES: hypothetical protein [unclassified Meiothermus]